jgi:hypothetical protein
LLRNISARLGRKEKARACMMREAGYFYSSSRSYFTFLLTLEVLHHPFHSLSIERTEEERRKRV